MGASQILEANKKLIDGFVSEYKIVNKIKGKREYKYYSYLGKVNGWLSKPFNKANKKDMIKVYDRISNSNLSGETKNDMVKLLRTFARHQGWDVSWMKANFKTKELLATDILTEEEINKLVKAGRTVRERAFLMCLYETGARSMEIRAIRLKHVQFNDKNVYVTLPESKTKTRTLPLRASLPYLQLWINEHPFKDDKEAYLFCNSKPENSLSDTWLRSILRECAEKAAIKKKMWLHLIRHSRATHLTSQGMNDSLLRKWMGWSSSSRVPGRYTHLSTEDLATWTNGKKEIKDTDEFIRDIKCVRCGTMNKQTNKICQNCLTVLSDEEAMKQQEKIGWLFELMNTPEFQLLADKFLESKNPKII